MAANIPQNTNNLFQPTGPQNETLLPYLIAHGSSNSTSGGSINCNQVLYGNPPAASCKDAIGQIPQDPATLLRNRKRVYGPRAPVVTVSHIDVGLPKRWISSQSLFYFSMREGGSKLENFYSRLRSADDGKCIVDITQTGYPSHCTDLDILEAPLVIQNMCIDERPGTPVPWGGEAFDMGLFP